jgi:hypothetical protein
MTQHMMRVIDENQVLKFAFIAPLKIKNLLPMFRVKNTDGVGTRYVLS